MRIFHFADIHLDPATRDNVGPALDHILAAARECAPDLIVNAGDLVMKRGHLSPAVALRLREFHVALAAIAPVIVVAGNHDLAAPGEPGAVFGALELADAKPGTLTLCERPGALHSPFGFWVACLPYPSRSWLLAQRPDLKASEVNEAMSAALLDTLRGLAAEVGPGPALLVFHGSIASATTDSEQTMTSELDVVLDEADIPACFAHVLCGHIHKPQTIGRCVYPGSIAPLTFAEARSRHGYVLWEGPRVGALVPTFKEIPVAHPLVTVDARKGVSEVNLAELAGARVRVLDLAGSGETPAAVRERWTRLLTDAGAHEVRVMVERPESVRTFAEVSAESSLDTLIRLHTQRHPDLEPIREGLLALAHEVEAELPAEVRLKAMAGGYVLRRLEWSDWKSYGPGNALDLDDLGAVVSIEGPNATGKSNAAEVEAFALYGRSVRGRQSLAELVREGCTDATVAAEFDAAGARWRVERRIKVNGKGVGAASVALKRYVPVPEYGNLSKDGRMSVTVRCEWQPADSATGRETDAAIEAMVGDFDLYRCTRFASQEDIARLLDLTPAQMKDTLQATVAADIFPEREKVARARLNAALADEQAHEGALAVWRQLAEQVDTRRQEAEEARAALVRCREAASVAETDLGVAMDGYRRAAADLDGIEALAKAWDEAHARVGAAEAALAELEASLVLDRERVKRGEDAVRERQNLPAARDRVSDLKAIQAGRAALVEAEQAAQAVVHGAKQAVLDAKATALRESQAHHKTCNAELGALNALKARVEADRRRRAESVTLLERVPFGEKCAEAGCEFVQAAVAARDVAALWEAEVAQQVEDAQMALSAARAELANAEAAAADAIARAEAMLASAREAAQVAATRLAQAQDMVPAIREAEAAVTRLDALERDVRDADGAAARLQLAEVRLEAARAELDAARAAAPAGERPASAGLSVLRDEARARVQVAEQQVNSATAAVDAAVEADALARQQVLASEDAARTVGEAAERSEHLAARVNVARAYLDACGRDGLPYLMLERALPALESHANHFLCGDLGSGLRVSIDAARELQSGQTRSEVVIRYANDFGDHSLAAASGFERMAIGYALRVALAQVLSESRGVPLTHVIADEGWGAFDEANTVRVGQPMVRRIAERCGRFILISHVAAILAACDTRITVIGDPSNGSRLEVQ